MSYGLKDETVEGIKNVFTKYPEVNEAILYGSRAKGNFRPGSDIDLTLKGKCLNLQLLNKISLAIDDLLLPYTVDLSIYHQIDNPDLIEHIERVGKIFYQSRNRGR
ncbi:MAG: nucleotidyltransferase domain-containing protein [Proteobacteria bacterium]|nr:nucleotidyltransferase domain-containing protein [Pseudomonadota bacterium]MBU4295546.1 nucleotidyltransferase domain-containing protein [Pseudomonadota bacterium]MCG2748041.1 nucleotidyltransferase domain-containing protein [Desulfobulbaceae bacterium]